MKKAAFTVDKNLCMDCSFALRRFIGGLDGVDSIDVEQGKVVVSFNEQKIDQDELTQITRDSIQRLGYRLED